MAKKKLKPILFDLYIKTCNYIGILPQPIAFKIYPNFSILFFNFSSFSIFVYIFLLIIYLFFTITIIPNPYPRSVIEFD